MSEQYLKDSLAAKRWTARLDAATGTYAACMTWEHKENVTVI